MSLRNDPIHEPVYYLNLGLLEHFVKFNLCYLKHTFRFASGFRLKLLTRDLNNVKAILRCAGISELDLYNLPSLSYPIALITPDLHWMFLKV